jgi:hypothetical protein
MRLVHGSVFGFGKLDLSLVEQHQREVVAAGQGLEVIVAEQPVAHLQRSPTFDFSLDLILDGLARRPDRPIHDV